MFCVELPMMGEPSLDEGIAEREPSPGLQVGKRQLEEELPSKGRGREHILIDVEEAVAVGHVGKVEPLRAEREGVAREIPLPPLRRCAALVGDEVGGNETGCWPPTGVPPLRKSRTCGVSFAEVSTPANAPSATPGSGSCWFGMRPVSLQRGCWSSGRSAST
jgi:hypothetical protein